MKTLIYKNCAYIEDKENGVVDRPGLDIAQMSATSFNYTDIFYSIIPASIQTALAIVASLGIKAKVHPPVKNIFPNCLGDCAYETLVTEIGNGIEQMFAAMDNGAIGLAVAHHFYMPYAKKYFGHDTGMRIEPLEFIKFTQDDEGNITIDLS